MTARQIRAPDAPSPHVLVPFDAREAISIAVAARLSGFSHAHTRRLVDRFDLGRPLGGGTWRVSRVAWAAFLDGDAAALREYHAGLKTGPAIRPYFDRFGLSPPASEQAA